MRKIDLLVLLLSAALLAACSGGSSGSGNGIGEDLIGKWQWGSGYMHVYADGHYIYESPDYDDAEEEYVDSAYYLNGQWSVNGSSLTISKADPIGLDGSVIDDIDPCMLLNGAFDVTVTNVFLEGEGVGAGLYFGAGWEVFTTPDYELACGPLNPPNEEDYLAWVRESLIPGDYDYFPPILPTPPDDGLTDAEFYDLFGRHSRSLWFGIDFTYGCKPTSFSAA
ncbi:MAG: hypothetical protein C0609_12125 [Deltaproteobacteria bacterium]|nr:MAG: hypothetical protein C0609_12125 [Deltaproteobacteria bacterium]